MFVQWRPNSLSGGDTATSRHSLRHGNGVDSIPRFLRLSSASGAVFILIVVIRVRWSTWYPADFFLSRLKPLLRERNEANPFSRLKPLLRGGVVWPPLPNLGTVVGAALAAMRTIHRRQAPSRLKPLLHGGGPWGVNRGRGRPLRPAPCRGRGSWRTAHPWCRASSSSN